MLRAIIVPQHDWAVTKSDEEIETVLKREVLEPYNQTVAPYKKLMNLFVYRGDLPRTKLDKLQRFKLPSLVLAGKHSAPEKEDALVEPAFPEYKVIKQYIRSEKHCPVRPTDHIETDLAFDSLDKIGLQGFLEQTFGMEITVEQIAKFPNVTAMAEYVADFKTRIEDTPNYQGNAVVNCTSQEQPYTRIIEHKHFEMFGADVYSTPKTVVSEEYSTEYKEGMEPYYPVNNDSNNALVEAYRKLAHQEGVMFPEDLSSLPVGEGRGGVVLFGGRLAEYKYYDMAPIIEKVLNLTL